MTEKEINKIIEEIENGKETTQELFDELQEYIDDIDIDIITYEIAKDYLGSFVDQWRFSANTALHKLKKRFEEGKL